MTLIDTIATARREHQGHQLSSRWNVRARRERMALGRADEALRERWAGDPAQWLTFGMTLAMSQRILAEAGRPLDSGSEGAMQGSVPVSDESL